MITNSLDAAVASRAAGSEPPGAAISARGVRKAYGEHTALDGVDLTVGRGELLALLGPNGAGKTTLVEILEGHRRADGGDVSVLGFDPGGRDPAFRSRIGIVLQEEGLDPGLTAGEAVDLYGAAYPDPRPGREVLELVGLADRAGARTSTLSGGQQRRLDLALGLVGRPELLFLDEPTTGFDPAARRASWALIERLREEGTTILLTTHYLDEAEALADRVVVLSRGRVLAEGAPADITGTSDAVVAFGAPGDLAELPLPAGALRDERDRISFRTGTPTRDLAPLLAWAADRELELDALTVTRPDLEDVYLELTREESA